jgi:hypothetical protein
MARLYCGQHFSIGISRFRTEPDERGAGKQRIAD